MIAKYGRVRLVTDRFSGEHANAGMVGYVIEIYPDGNFEVEFSNADGTAVAQVVASERDLVRDPEAHGATSKRSE